MRRLVALSVIGLLLAACGSGHSASPTPVPTHVAQAERTPTPTTVPVKPHPRATPVPTRSNSTGPSSPPPPPASPPSSPYLAFLSATCRAFASGDAATISNELPYYQYNSGVRYGSLGDGEGQTGDPSLLGTWLQGGTVRCEYYTPDIAGHGTFLASGWNQPGGWSLIELDIFNGAWKINDFTFGSRGALYQAMQTSQPILAYHAR